MKRFLGAFLLFLMATTAGLVFVFQNLKPVSSETSTRNFVINPGDSSRTIAVRLEKNGFIRNRYLFILIARQLQLNKNLQAGLFRLSPSLSTREVVVKLAQGGSQDYWLKILDGQRVEEITPEFDPSLEGYLFPDSYLIPNDYQIDQIQKIISDNFNKKFSAARVDATVNLTDNNAVILASIIEREARTLESKQKVAGVLLNRLKINMALQVDASAQYARDSLIKPQKYWAPLASADVRIKSAYNTYLSPGLPPGPICNPGYDSLYAAFHPIDSDYLYYITGNDNKMHFASTLDEHNQNIAKYLK